MNFDFEGGLDVCPPADQGMGDPNGMGMMPNSNTPQNNMFEDGVGSRQSLVLVTQQLHSNKNYRQVMGCLEIEYISILSL